MALKELVYNFRKAIEAAQTNGEIGTFFRKFPTGQCGHTSDMLAQYLINNGFKQITYVNGTYYGDDWDDRWSHTWLVVNEQIIDITGDQFKYYKKPLQNNITVYVGPSNSFYDSFEVHPSGRFEHFGLNKQWINYSELRNWYETILRYL